MKIKLGIRITADTISDTVFVVYFSFPLFQRILGKCFSFSGLNGESISLFLLALLFCTVVLTAPSERWLKSLLLYLAIILVFLISYIYNPSVGSWYTNPNWGIWKRVFRIDRGIYAFLVVSLVPDEEHLKRDLQICGFLTLALLLWMLAGRLRAGYWMMLRNDGLTMVRSPYNMDFGYRCIFTGMIFILFKDERYKKLYTLIGYSLFLSAVIYGSRGSLLLLIAFFGIWLLRRMKTGFSSGMILFFFALFVAGIIFLVFNRSGLAWMQNLLRSLNLSSRTLNLLLKGKLNDSFAREKIWAVAQQMIRDKFPLGYGAYGDRTVIGALYAWGYSHNIVLEFVASFGILGILLFIAIIYTSLRIILNHKKEVWRSCFILFFICSLKLLISDSFWFNPYFWAAAAIVSVYDRRSRVTIALVRVEESVMQILFAGARGITAPVPSPVGFASTDSSLRMHRSSAEDESEQKCRKFKQKAIRDSNIELLRIFAAIGVIILHYNNAKIGTAMAAAPIYSANSLYLYVMESICICAVDLFMIISGFYSFTRTSVSLRRIIRILVQISILKAIFTFVFAGIDGVVLTEAQYRMSLLPLNHFLIIYCAVALIAPFMNLMVRSLNRTSVIQLCVVLLLLFSVWPYIADTLEVPGLIRLKSGSTISSAGSGSGYTIVNYIMMYLIGASIRRLNIQVKKRFALPALLFIWTLLFVTGYLHHIDYAGLGPVYSYCNPFVIFSAVFLFLLFREIPLGRNRLINELAGAALVVYLTHKYIIERIATEIADTAKNYTLDQLVCHQLIYCMILYLLGYAIHKAYQMLAWPVYRLIDHYGKDIQISASDERHDLNLRPKELLIPSVFLVIYIIAICALPGPLVTLNKCVIGQGAMGREAGDEAVDLFRTYLEEDSLQTWSIAGHEEGAFHRNFAINAAEDTVVSVRHYQA